MNKSFKPDQFPTGHVLKSISLLEDERNRIQQKAFDSLKANIEILQESVNNKEYKEKYEKLHHKYTHLNTEYAVMLADMPTWEEKYNTMLLAKDESFQMKENARKQEIQELKEELDKEQAELKADNAKKLNEANNYLKQVMNINSQLKNESISIHSEITANTSINNHARRIADYKQRLAQCDSTIEGLKNEIHLKRKSFLLDKN